MPSQKQGCHLKNKDAISKTRMPSQKQGYHLKNKDAISKNKAAILT